MPRMGSVQAACLVAAAAALAAAVPAAAGSGAPAPLKQMDAGAGAGDILCNGDRVLLVSPGGAPACILARSLGTLAERGWREGPEGWGGHGPAAGRGGPDASAAAPCGPEHNQAVQGGVASAPRWPNIHHTTVTISKYPVVGEVAEMTFTVTTTDESRALSTERPLASLTVGTSPVSKSHRVFDMISNIGTGDPGVFRPYDPDNVTTVARPGETYTVKAKFVISEEGFMSIGGRGLHNDFASVYIAASKNASMSTEEYHATGQTYLDHTRATGQAEPCPLPECDTDLTVPHWPVNRATLLGEYHEMYSSFAEVYVDIGYTEDQIVKELFSFGHLRSDIREFFVHIMNYTGEQAGAVRMGDDLLGFAYMASPACIDDVVHDMLARRNYTADEARDLLRDHMFYTDDEAAALVRDAAAAGGWAGAAG